MHGANLAHLWDSALTAIIWVWISGALIGFGLGYAVGWYVSQPYTVEVHA